MKKSSSRSQRGSKGIKGKHILQICVLLGICIWLIYQVKYSNDKKKEFYEKDSKKSTELLEGVDGLVKLGRKDLPGGYQERHVEDEDEEEIGNGEDEKEKEKETRSKLGNGSHEEEEEEEVEEEEEDKNKQVEEDEIDEEENKHGEDDEREDVIDEQDQSRIGDTDRDDELLEEEKENGSKDTNVDEIDMSVHEAREEHYKADDASSAVSHESRVLNTEKLNETFGQSNVTGQVKIEKEPILKFGEAESGDLVEKTATEVRDTETKTEVRDTETKTEVRDTETKTVETELKDEVNRNSTIEASGFVKNGTRTGQEHEKSEDVAPLARSSDPQIVDLQQPGLNITVSANSTHKDFSQDESRNLTSESIVNENISGSNTTMVTENSETEAYDEKESSKLDSADETEETDDASETRISMKEREALIDPETLPDVRREDNEEEEEALGAE